MLQDFIIFSIYFFNLNFYILYHLRIRRLHKKSKELGKYYVLTDEPITTEKNRSKDREEAVLPVSP